MYPTLSSLSMAIAIAASAGLFLSACGSSDLATALPSDTPATLVSSVDPTSTLTEESEISTTDDLPPILEDLNLTETQQQQAEQIRQSSRSQIRSLMTPEQIALLESFEGEDREALRALQDQMDLSESQREQIGEILRASAEDLRGLLTAEQIATLEEAAVSFEGLDLSDSQREQIGQIQMDSWTQIQAVLTSEQLALLKSYSGSDLDSFQALQDQLNLTEAQQAQIDAIRADSREQVQALLNADQLETLQGAKEGLERLKARRAEMFNN